MADHPPSWPSCPCDRCFAAAARGVIGQALPAIVAGAFTPSPAEPAQPPRPRAVARRKPARTRRANAAPPAIATAVKTRPRKPAPPTIANSTARAAARTCRVCGDADPAGWSQAELCTAPACLSAAAKVGRDRVAAQRAPRAAKAKRLGRIARLAGRRDRLAAEAELAELADDHEDIDERMDRVPEVMP